MTSPRGMPGMVAPRNPRWAMACLCMVAAWLPAARAAAPWPAVDGAVFALRDGDLTKPVIAFDAKGRRLLAFDCAPTGWALVGRFHDFVCDGGWFHARQAGDWVGSRVRAANAFSLELSLTPARAVTEGSRVVAAFADEDGEDAAVLQRDDGIVLRVRGGQLAPLFPVETGKTVHVVVTAAGDRWRAYRNGDPVADGPLPADAAAWEAREVVFGAGWGGVEAWHGRLETIALFPRALTAEEVEVESAAATGLRTDRPAASPIRFRGTLVRQAETTDVEAMRPYTRSLTAAEYTVDEVLDGAFHEPTITVLHWMVLDGQRLPIADRRPGTKVVLVVEPLAQHPQLESCRRDELIGGDLTADVFYCEQHELDAQP